MKSAIAILSFAALSMQSAWAADCYSYSDYEDTNNNIAACYAAPAAKTADASTSRATAKSAKQTNTSDTVTVAATPDSPGCNDYAASI